MSIMRHEVRTWSLTSQAFRPTISCHIWYNHFLWNYVYFCIQNSLSVHIPAPNICPNIIIVCLEWRHKRRQCALWVIWYSSHVQNMDSYSCITNEGKTFVGNGVEKRWFPELKFARLLLQLMTRDKDFPCGFQT